MVVDPRLTQITPCITLHRDTGARKDSPVASAEFPHTENTDVAAIFVAWQIVSGFNHDGKTQEEMLTNRLKNFDRVYASVIATLSQHSPYDGSS